MSLVRAGEVCSVLKASLERILLLFLGDDLLQGVSLADLVGFLLLLNEQNECLIDAL